MNETNEDQEYCLQCGTSGWGSDHAIDCRNNPIPGHGTGYMRDLREDTAALKAAEARIAELNEIANKNAKALTAAQARCEEMRSDVIRCEAAIKALVPSHRSPSENCWCPDYVDPNWGREHTIGCLLAGAALAALGKASKSSGGG
jgi:hypothetical protein